MTGKTALPVLLALTLGSCGVYGEWEPTFEPLVLNRLQAYQFGQEIELIAFRSGQDRDGRTYTIRVIAFDLAGNAKEEEVEVVVPHDQRERRE